MFKLEERNPSAASAGRVHTPTPTEYQDKACPNRDVPRFTHISIRARKHLSSAGEDDSMGRCAIKPIRHARKTDQMKGSKMKDDGVTQWGVGGSLQLPWRAPLSRRVIVGVQGRALSAGACSAGTGVLPSGDPRQWESGLTCSAWRRVERVVSVDMRHLGGYLFRAASAVQNGKGSHVL